MPQGVYERRMVVLRYGLPCSQLIMPAWSYNKLFTIVSLLVLVRFDTSALSSWGKT